MWPYISIMLPESKWNIYSVHVLSFCFVINFYWIWGLHVKGHCTTTFLSIFKSNTVTKNKNKNGLMMVTWATLAWIEQIVHISRSKFKVTLKSFHCWTLKLTPMEGIGKYFFLSWVNRSLFGLMLHCSFIVWNGTWTDG